MKTLFCAALLLATLSSVHGDIYLPAADGVVAYNGAVDSSGGINISDAGGFNLEGDFQFASFNTVPYTSIQLELNPYAEPLTISTLYVYGYDNASGQLSGSDYNAGTYLGAWVLPSLGFGQETFFDVTEFVDSASGSYFGFDIRTAQNKAVAEDAFSSSALNYGIPPELVATPEPSVAALIGLAALSQAAIGGKWKFRSFEALFIKRPATLKK